MHLKYYGEILEVLAFADGSMLMMVRKQSAVPMYMVIMADETSVATLIDTDSVEQLHRSWWFAVDRVNPNTLPWSTLKERYRS